MDRDQLFTFPINKKVRVHQRTAVGLFKVNNSINYIALYIHGYYTHNILLLKTVQINQVRNNLSRDCTRPWKRDLVKVI